MATSRPKLGQVSETPKHGVCCSVCGDIESSYSSLADQYQSGARSITNELMRLMSFKVNQTSAKHTVNKAKIQGTLKAAVRC